MVSLSELRDVPPWLPEHFVGGHPALDFINTVSHRADLDLAVDRFDSLEKIAGWCEFSGLLDANAARLMQDSPSFRDREDRLVKRLAELRSRGGGIFDSIAGSRDIPAKDFAGVLTIAGAAVESSEFVFASNRLRIWNPDRLISPDRLVGMLALQALDAFYCLPHDRLRACPGCHWLFYDSSRGGRRKWCSMRNCGNRAKVSHHYKWRKGGKRE